MSYYDNVKDSVKEDSGSGANFDSLKEAAQDTSEEEQKGDDTEIEVLEEGLNPQPSGKTQKEKKREQRQQAGIQASGGNPGVEQVGGGSGDAQHPQQSGPGTASQGDVEQKLDRIIEQNDRMIEILQRMV